MKNGRPHLKVPFQTIDTVIELTSIAILILMWSYCILNYTDLPNSIATHFNGSGKPDDFGSKHTIWIIPFIGTVIYFGLFILNKYPHTHNYMVNITQENALKNYRLSTRVIRVVNLLGVLLIAYITFTIIESAFGEKLEIGSWFIPVVIGFSVILPIVLIVYMKKLNKD